MIIKINNYDGQYRIASFAKTYETMSCLLDKQLNVIMVNNKKIVFYPENLSFELCENSMTLFSNSCEYDVFEISNAGNAYKYYDNNSIDNAILVTNKCNSNCIMCPTANSVRKGEESYTGKELVELAKYIPNDAVHITITGGEPFLIKKDMFVLLEYLKRNFPLTSFLLLTNGRAFCIKEYVDLFNKTAPRDLQIAVPLHGYDSSTHDYIVQSVGAFKQTFIGLKHLMSIGAKIEIRIVVSKLNMDFLDKISELIINEFKKVYCVKFIGLELTGNAAVNKDMVWLDYPTAFKKSKVAIDLLINAGIDVGIYNFPLCAVDKNYWNICEKSISPHKIRFATQCDSCRLKDACGGVFSGTIRLAKEQIYPIR